MTTGDRVRWFDLATGAHEGVVERVYGPTSVVQAEDGQAVVPTHWLEVVEPAATTPTAAESCAACAAAVAGQHLFEWEARHTCDWQAER